MKTLKSIIYLCFVCFGSMSGQAKEVKMAKANWDTGYFQAEVYKMALEELGYKVKEAKGYQALCLLCGSCSRGFRPMGQWMVWNPRYVSCRN